MASPMLASCQQEWFIPHEGLPVSPPLADPWPDAARGGPDIPATGDPTRQPSSMPDDVIASFSAVGCAMVRKRRTESHDGASGGPAHTHLTESQLAACRACRLVEARADLNRAQRRLRRLQDEGPGGGDVVGG
jgi:hypothetical protein